jgi:hypothetical protein
MKWFKKLREDYLMLTEIGTFLRYHFGNSSSSYRRLKSSSTLAIWDLGHPSLCSISIFERLDPSSPEPEFRGDFIEAVISTTRISP